jgi:hypothetical protein
MEEMYLVIWIVRIPYSTLGDRCFIEDRASVGTAKPFDPIRDFCRREILGQEVVLYRCLHSIVDLAPSFNQTLIALCIGIKLRLITV